MVLEFNAKALDNLLRRRFFVAPSFEIYGSSAGLFDFGPNGCAMKNEIEAFWRRHFVLEEDLLEIHGPNLTPHPVLKASGHVDRFLDFMVEDTVTKECYRADKLIEDWFDKLLAEADASKGDKARMVPRERIEQICNTLEGMNAQELDAVINEFKILSPAKNSLSTAYPFNLMFSTKIGPKPGADENSGLAYLRPETAQGIFVNFRRLYEQNNGRMPFGAACVGTSFRNEIAPRNGLLRVREFPMAEVEFFCDPLSKAKFAKFSSVENLGVPLYSRDRQNANEGPCKMTLRHAVQQRVVDNETLAYFIGRTYLFLKAIGVQEEGLRFRQHLATEMAHYASDCWDAEILTSYKWIECVGIADRSAFDLTQHSMVTKVDLLAARQLSEPRTENRIEAVLNRKLMGPHYKKDLSEVLAAIDALTEEDKIRCEAELVSGKGACTVTHPETQRSFTVDAKFLSFTRKDVRVVEEPYTPNVIEPSFGIGRIFYAVLEHAFGSRGLQDQEDRNFLALSPIVAPIKASLLPISNAPEFQPLLSELRQECLKRELSVKIDSSNASIGKRYARTDEIGVPYGITMDFLTLEDKTVTMREMRSMEQVRLPMLDVPDLLKKLVRMSLTWDDIKQTYPMFCATEAAQVENKMVTQI